MPEAQLVISEQPQPRGFRFRYKCEGGSHGGLQGESSKRSSKTFPTVQVLNYRGPVRIIVSLVTDEEEPKIHAHELVGKHCDNGMCIVKYQETDTMKIKFQGLGVQHVTKKSAEEILYNRMLQEEIYHLNMQRKDMKLPDNYKCSTLNDDIYRQKAKEYASVMQLNVVRLKFQAYLQDSSGHFTHVLPAVISNAIHDSKSPGAAALKICRMDKYEGCCKGGEEVFLLCDKVQKEDISVRFFERDSGGTVKWEGYGGFSTTDVHRQFAIVFRTPPYPEDIHSPIDVFVQLKRMSDGEKSEPVKFIYLPEQTDKEEVKRKRQKTIFPPSPEEPDPIEYTQYSNNNNNVSTTTTTASANNTNNISHAYNFSNHTDFILDDLLTIHTKFSEFPADFPNLSTDLPDLHDLEPHLALPAFNGGSDGYDSEADASPLSRVTKTTCSDVEEAFMDIQNYGGLEDFIDCNRVEEEEGEDLGGVKERGVAEDNIVPKSQKPLSKTPNIQISQSINDITERMLKLRMATTSNKRLKSLDTFKAIQRLSCSGDMIGILRQYRQEMLMCDKDGDTCLHQAIIHKQFDVVKAILSTFIRSDTPTAPPSDTPTDLMRLLNTRNHLNQTPLLLAVITNQPEVIDLLLCHPCLDLSLINQYGNTVLHQCCADDNPHALQAILTAHHKANPKGARGGRKSQGHGKEDLFKILNFEGLTCLHCAVLSDSLGCVEVLLPYCTDTVNEGDGRSGRTPLHHAVQANNISIAGHILLEGNVDVDAVDYDGNSALHLASSLGHTEIAKLLLTCGANSLLENYDVTTINDMDENDDLIQYSKGLTPLMMSDGCTQMRQILTAHKTDGELSSLCQSLSLDPWITDRSNTNGKDRRQTDEKDQKQPDVKGHRQPDVDYQSKRGSDVIDYIDQRPLSDSQEADVKDQRGSNVRSATSSKPLSITKPQMTAVSPCNQQVSPCHSDYGSYKGECHLLPPDGLEKLCDVLNRDKDWIRLAEVTQNTQAIDPCERCDDPAKEFLMIYEIEQNGSLEDLEILLLQLSCYEALEIIKQYKDNIFLDPVGTKAFCSVLDHRDQWINLAANLNLSGHVNYFKKYNNPTWNLLLTSQNKKASYRDIEDALLDMGHTEALAILHTHGPKQACYTMSNRQESGFDSLGHGKTISIV